MSYTTADPVTVSLADLEAGTIPSSTLLTAFGPDSLGIIVVTSLPPRFAILRTRVLSSASHLAALPPATLSTLEVPSANYLVGWSCGKEQLSEGRVDTLKGSYYINCAFYLSPTLEGAELAPGMDGKGCEGYTAPNVWPPLLGFESDVKELCSIVIDTAALVARACDRYAAEMVEGYTPGYLEHVVKTSTTTKARLLHYFPPTGKEGEEGEGELDSWCGTHLDHGCLTGLTSAMYVDEGKGEVMEMEAPPDKEAGLYIRDRVGRVVKVAIPREALAFQTGEALERITKGRFRAVPHFVRGMRAEVGRGVARNTLAVFTQPNLWEKVDGDMDFAGFAKMIVDKNTAM